MSTYLTSDLHLGHDRCAVQFRRGISFEEYNEISPEERIIIVKRHDEEIMDELAIHVRSKKDGLIIAGDLSLNAEHGCALINKLPGTKHLLLGNHEHHNMRKYINTFNKIMPGMRKKDFTITHIPLHPEELGARDSIGRINIHGHRHNTELSWSPDPQHLYFNICWDRWKGPLTIEIIEEFLRNGKAGEY